MYKLLLIFFIFVSIFLVSIIMFQNNDDIDISASSSDAKSPFNTNMSNQILTRSIILLASLFFIISLLLSNMNVKKYMKNIKLHSIKK
ncbi:preprotein translocase subunit SecG [Enterobacteriaceae endosymbiont of Donacia thalassina]|uniref:preprotein translocase subunit SecG n=1 Tax=Enterobacteriaceae endosymbiont of Donacia thalassina TaxID=2675786 RepID=UPI001449B041|nr:preprotein translocase subunit SecG [Enterobacteriaceae endosymbiont of Donacia thalassina]QJC37415.1 preprotein translocase subunit SecG [Enterobacteriaceae endosymbiont of Donacia thalassina]